MRDTSPITPASAARILDAAGVDPEGMVLTRQRVARARDRPPWWNDPVEATGLLDELYGRLPPLARGAVEGLDREALTERVGPDANTIAWLVWHATRVQDHHVAELLDVDQVWVEGTWAARFGLAPDPSNTGYGHAAEDVGRVVPSGPDDLLDYLDAVHARTVAFLRALSAEDLDRVVDRRWDPPVTMAVRLVSIADDGLQHVGQAAYVRGLLGR